MGLPSLLTDPNFLYLTHLLKISPRETYGILDYGWLLFNITGDPHYKNSAHLEALLFWEGKPGALSKAMLAAGFLKRKGKDRLIIADHERRLQDWGKKRLQRAEEAAAENGGQRRKTADFRRPTDPDPGSLSKRENIKPFDLDHGKVQNRDRPKPATPDSPRALKNPQQAPQALVSEVCGAFQGAGVRQTRQSAPPPEMPIGQYSAKECALAAASLDRGNDHDSAVAMFTVRAAEMSCYSGGIAAFQDILVHVYNSRRPDLHKGTGAIHNPGAYINKKTAEWLQGRKTA